MLFVWFCKVVIALITGRNEVVAKVIFLHLFVILFTGGVCLSACWDTPRSRHLPRPDPPGADPPSPEQTPPPHSRPPWSRPPPWTRPPQTRPPPEQTPPGSRHTPRESDSSIRSTSGRYASYWNAFLFYI